MISWNRRLVVSGDFNAKSTMCGAKYFHKNGEMLEELISSRGMNVVNEGNKPTFVRGNQTSRIDVTMYIEDLGGRIKKW